MKKGFLSLPLIIWLMAPSALARDIAPPWVHVQLQLRQELRDCIERYLAERGERNVAAEGLLDQDLSLWRPLLAEYWVSGDDGIPSVIGRELKASCGGAEFVDGYYADSQKKAFSDPFAALVASLAYVAPRSPDVRRLISDAAEHIGNWGSERSDGTAVPPWYDWERHHFRSACLGTERVAEFPPFGVDLPSNLRFLRLGIVAYLVTGEDRYLEWCRDYADEWVRDMRGNNWIAPSEISVPTHEVGGFSGKWYRLTLDPDWSWEGVGLAHAQGLSSLVDLGAVAGEPAYATALAHQIEVMWSAADGPVPLTFFDRKGWSARGSKRDQARQRRNEKLLALQLLRLRRMAGVRSFDDRILAWAESLEGEGPVDPLVYALAYEVSRDDDWLVRSLRLATKNLREARGKVGEALAAEVAAQVLMITALEGVGMDDGGFPGVEMLFGSDGEELGIPPDLAAVTVREGSKVRCRFYSVGSATQAVTLLPPFEDQSYGRVQTFRAKILGRAGRGVTVRVIPGYNTWVIAELPLPDDFGTWDPPAPRLVEPATPSLNVLSGPGEIQRAREQIRNWFLGRARDLDRRRWLKWEDLTEKREREKYRDSIRSRLLQAIGGLPQRTPLEPTQAGTIERPGYRIEKWLIQSRAEFYVPLNLYVPERVSEPVAGVLVFCGHKPEGKAAHDYQALCIDLVREGYVVLIHDPLGQGERGTYYQPSTGNEHFHAGNQCYLLGWNLAQFFIWDAMRAIDFLVERPEVDPDRIGCAGSSGGGTLTQYVAALDARIRVAAPACYPCDTLAHFVELGPDRAGEHPENVIFGDLERGIDQFGRSLLISPRPMLLNAAVEDFVPIEGTRLLHRRLLTAYAAEGATDALSLYEDPSGHGYSAAQREATVRFFNRWLRQDEGEFKSAVTEDDYETAEALACAPGEQVANLESETVHSQLKRAAEQLEGPGYAGDSAEEARAHQAKIGDRVRSLLGIPADRGVGQVEDRGALRLEDAIVRKVLLRDAWGILIPSLLAFRADPPRDAPAVILLGDQGKPGTGGEDVRLFVALVAEGFTVLAVDPRGMGETKLNDSEDYYAWRKGTESSLTYRSFQIGDPLFGQRVRDVLTAVDFVCAGSDQCNRKVAVCGQGYGGLLALATAAADERVAAAAAVAPLYSYRSLLEKPEYAVSVSAFIPGVLASFDVPDLVAAVGPRPALVLNAVGARAELVGPTRFLDAYGGCKDIHDTLGGSFVHRSVPWDEVAQAVTDWLSDSLRDR